MSTPLVRVRVRGIYATALTKLLLDAGFQIVQASRVISERFSIPQIPAPADVTVKDANDPSEILVIGYPQHAKEVLKTLMDALPYSFYWKSKLPLHATVRAKIKGVKNGTCIGEVGPLTVEIDGVDECTEGREIIASVVRPAVKPNETPKVRPGARVVGDYVILYECSERRVTFSEHIRSSTRRAELLSIATSLSRENICVHWRSSAQYGDPTDLQRHIQELYNLLAQVKKELDSSPSGTVKGGELVAIASLSSVDKRRLDELRSAVIPTAPLHHTLKSLEPEKQDIIDLLDILSKHVDQTTLYRAEMEYIASSITGRRLPLYHVKPDGTTVKLGEAYVESAVAENGELEVRVKRIVRGQGYYDGLNVEKEPGDVIETTITTGRWYIVHHYYSKSGELKGTYININTPPEITTSKIRYLDLAVDVVKKPGSKPQVLDLDELARALSQGMLPFQLACKAIETVNEHVGEDSIRDTVQALENNIRQTLIEALDRCRGT